MKLINCDLGECLSSDPDSHLMPLIDMANIACGGHAGNYQSMEKTIKLAKQHGVTVGAHPSYSDRVNFGRLSHHYSEQQLFDLLVQQISAFNELCQIYDMKMAYIKPHGALYHDMMNNSSVFAVLCELITTFDANLDLVVQAGIWSQDEVSDKSTSAKLVFEAFADRGYRQGRLIPRSEQGALLAKAEQIKEQYLQFCSQAPFRIDTVCFHSDHSPSLTALQMIKGENNA